MGISNGQSRDLWGMVLATASALVALFIMLYKIDPNKAPTLSLVLFYFVLTASVCGVITIAGYVARRMTARNFIHEHIIVSSFWNGFYFSLAVTGLLLFKKFA